MASVSSNNKAAKQAVFDTFDHAFADIHELLEKPSREIDDYWEICSNRQNIRQFTIDYLAVTPSRPIRERLRDTKGCTPVNPILSTPLSLPDRHRGPTNNLVSHLFGGSNTLPISPTLTMRSPRINRTDKAYFKFLVRRNHHDL
ncbi:hypothetical protein CVT26_013127 [Gymnopilus dilepis]|uniref:Uncharacterized protein n=1 Tax=Gymnopilus dilepis TaxID=231916 RepID=A0A409YF59_9AGAR|nr:hypothetical protein CVT26_013127 [Gymnopilus dilepis]